MKEKGIVLTLAENPKDKEAIFEFEVQNSLCTEKFTGSQIVYIGKPTPIFSRCGLTLIIKLTKVQKNVAYFEAYIGREARADD